MSRTVLYVTVFSNFDIMYALYSTVLTTLMHYFLGMCVSLSLFIVGNSILLPYKTRIKSLLSILPHMMIFLDFFSFKIQNSFKFDELSVNNISL